MKREAIDVVSEAILGKGVEEAEALFPIVRFSKIKNHWNIDFHVDQLNMRSRRRIGDGVRRQVGLEGGVGGRRRAHGGGEMEGSGGVGGYENLY